MGGVGLTFLNTKRKVMAHSLQVLPLKTDQQAVFFKATDFRTIHQK